MITRFLRLVLAATGFLFLTTFSFAHTGSIKGTVSDGETNVPMQGALITLSQKISTVSDALGGVVFNNLKAGHYDVAVSFVGYEVLLLSVDVREGETSTFSAQMMPSALQLDEVQIASGAGPEKLNTLAAIDLKLRPYKSSQDLLRVVPGLFIAQHAGGGKAEQIFLRGFDIDHGTDVSINVDGMPVNMVSHAHGQGYADMHFIIPEAVQNVSFQKGPYFADKGNFSTAGFVDLSTKDALDRSMLKMEAGQPGMMRTVGLFALPGSKQNGVEKGGYVGGEYLYSRSYFDAPQNFNRLNAIGKFFAREAGAKSFELTVSAFTSSWDASGQIPQRAVDAGLISRYGSIDPTEGGKTSRVNVQAETSNRIGNVLVSNSFYASHYTFDLFSNFSFYMHNSTQGDQIRQQESRLLAGYKGDARTTFDLLGKESFVRAGWGFRADATDNSKLLHTKARYTTLDTVKLGDIHETNFFGFLEHSIAFSRKLSLTTSVRFDQFLSSYDDKIGQPYQAQHATAAIISPKLNLTYQHNAQTEFFFRAGKGFHSNDTRAVVGQQSLRLLPPAYGTDLGATTKLLPSLWVQVIAWQLFLAQEFVYVGDEGIVEPSGKTWRKGFEASFRWQPKPWLMFDTDITYSRARAMGVPASEAHIPLAPVLTASGGVTVQHGSGFSASCRFRHLADRPANETNTIQAKGYFIADLRLQYGRKTWETFFTIENVFNQPWNEAQFLTTSQLKGETAPVSEIHFTPGIPFSARAGVTWYW